MSHHFVLPFHSFRTRFLKHQALPLLPRSYALLFWSVSIVTRLWTGRPEFDCQQGQGFILFATASKRNSGPIQPPVEWAPWLLFPGVKRPGRETEHSFSSSDEVKNPWSDKSLPQYVFMALSFVKCRDNFTFTCTGTTPPKQK